MVGIAARQRAKVTVAQLRGAGLTRGQIEHRVRTGWLLPMHRGVYHVGPVHPPFGEECAALLACPDAVLSHLSAAAVWGIAQRPDRVHLIAPTRRRNRRRVVVHEGTLAREEISVREGLSLTSPLRTLRDIERVSSRKAFERAVWEASFLRLITGEEARTLTGRAPPLAKHEGERVLEDLIRRAGLPAPLTNQRLHGWEVDFSWPDRNLVVELDGDDGHGHALGRARDTRKDLSLRGHGIDVVRFDGDQLAHEQPVVIASIAGALAARA